MGNDNQIPILEFSADPACSYLIQASTDLTNWMTIGTPVQEGGIGDYDFEDLNANRFTTRFYRVVTQSYRNLLLLPSFSDGALGPEIRESEGGNVRERFTAQFNWSHG